MNRILKISLFIMIITLIVMVNGNLHAGKIRQAENKESNAKKKEYETKAKLKIEAEKYLQKFKEACKIFYIKGTNTDLQLILANPAIWTHMENKTKILDKTPDSQLAQNIGNAYGYSKSKTSIGATELLKILDEVFSDIYSDNSYPFSSFPKLHKTSDYGFDPEIYLYRLEKYSKMQGIEWKKTKKAKRLLELAFEQKDETDEMIDELYDIIVTDELWDNVNNDLIALKKVDTHPTLIHSVAKAAHTILYATIQLRKIELDIAARFSFEPRLNNIWLNEKEYFKRKRKERLVESFFKQKKIRFLKPWEHKYYEMIEGSFKKAEEVYAELQKLEKELDEKTHKYIKQIRLVEDTIERQINREGLIIHDEIMNNCGRAYYKMRREIVNADL